MSQTYTTPVAIRTFIVQLLQERGPLPDEASIDTYRYLDTGHIDSIGFIKFIFRLEEQFGISFLAEEIGGDEIRTVDGLIRLISGKAQAGR